MSYQLLCCGDATELATWSNIPFFLLKAGQSRGLFTSGLALQPARLRWLRRMWNLQQWLRTGRPGGFQYSECFLHALWRQADVSQLPNAQSCRLLSHFPLLPPSPWPRDCNVSFYIDATTQQVFNAYAAGRRIAPDFQRDVMRRERAGYEAAKAVVTMSDWAAESVCCDYGISPERVHVVPGGANLDEQVLANLPQAPPPPQPSLLKPLRLGFLGKDWERKGGPFVLALAEELQNVGIPSVVRAIGPSVDELPAHPCLEPLGFISKSSQMPAFTKELQSWHFGTLFSNTEAFGISNRECLRLGVPVIGRELGGIPSTFSGVGCGYLFEEHANPVVVARWVQKQMMPYEKYIEMRTQLATHLLDFSWDAAVDKLQQILY
jgi:hypothetical protein